jgi:hypothetical protein
VQKYSARLTLYDSDITKQEGPRAVRTRTSPASAVLEEGPMQVRAKFEFNPAVISVALIHFSIPLYHDFLMQNLIIPRRCLSEVTS